jgi:phytoene synthase
LKGSVPTGKLTKQLFLLAEDTDLDPRAAIELVKGCRSDLSDEVLIPNEEQLIQYCYQVAGSVGIMMCAVLGVKDPRAIPHAIDLGIGMQLTNITRDISEDARSERRYLPATFVGSLSCTEILSSSNTSLENICEAVDKIVNLADRYYKSGREGFCFLPATSRQAIAIAASVYRQIGIRVRDNTEASLTRRTVVPQWEKLVLASAALLKGVLQSTAREIPTHDPALHQAIRSYPGANPEA